MNIFQEVPQADKLINEKERLTQRKGELAIDLENKKMEITRKNETISKLLIDGKPTKQLLDELAIDHTAVTSIETAIVAITKRLGEIEEEIKYQNSIGLRREFEDGIKKLTPEIVSIVKRLNEIYNEYEPLLETFSRLDDIARNRVYPRIRIESNDTYYAANFLSAMFEGHGGIRHRLDRINDTFSKRISKKQ